MDVIRLLDTQFTQKNIKRRQPLLTVNDLQDLPFTLSTPFDDDRL